jgi:hypothetical protein
VAWSRSPGWGRCSSSTPPLEGAVSGVDAWRPLLTCLDLDVGVEARARPLGVQDRLRRVRGEALGFAPRRPQLRLVEDGELEGLAPGPFPGGPDRTRRDPRANC